MILYIASIRKYSNVIGPNKLNLIEQIINLSKSTTRIGSGFRYSVQKSWQCWARVTMLLDFDIYKGKQIQTSWEQPWNSTGNCSNRKLQSPHRGDPYRGENLVRGMAPCAPSHLPLFLTTLKGEKYAWFWSSLSWIYAWGKLSYTCTQSIQLGLHDQVEMKVVDSNRTVNHPFLNILASIPFSSSPTYSNVCKIK